MTTVINEISASSSTELSFCIDVLDEKCDDYDIKDCEHHQNLLHIKNSLSLHRDIAKRDNELLSFDSNSNIFDASNCSSISYANFSDDESDDDCKDESTTDFSENKTSKSRSQCINIDSTNSINIKNNYNNKNNKISNNKTYDNTKEQNEVQMNSNDFEFLMKQNGLSNQQDISATSTTTSVARIATQYFITKDEDEYTIDEEKEDSLGDEGCWPLSPTSTIPSLFPSLSPTNSNVMPKKPLQHNISNQFNHATSKTNATKLQNLTTIQPETCQNNQIRCKSLKTIIFETSAFIEHNLSIIISQSKFLQEEDNCDRSTIPVFRRSEIITGQLLGKGGFSDVYEVMGFQLDPLLTEQLSAQQQQLRIDAVRNIIDSNTGRGRYVIKQLRESLLQQPKRSSVMNHISNDEECDDYSDFQVAACDLALEGMYLSRLNHPNIIKVHGLPYGGHQSFQLDGKYNSYFLICDRLHDTLDHRIDDVWPSTTPTNVSSYFDENTNNLHKRNNGNKENIRPTEPSIIQKVDYALQLANALQYLHQKRIVYRDLKPPNIGFSIDDTDRIILFDFGLCRELPNNSGISNSNDTTSTEHEQHQRDVDNDNGEILYEMSGVGTRRYMAPEIINTFRYNQKVDVYSWSMVLWEMLTLSKPYMFHSVEDHRVFVCRRGERPPLFVNSKNTSNFCHRHPNPTLIEAIQYVLKQSWKQSVHDRFSIDEVCDVLKRIISRHHFPATKLPSSAQHSLTDKLSVTEEDYYINKENSYNNERNSNIYDEHQIHFLHPRKRNHKIVSPLSRPHHQNKAQVHCAIEEAADFTSCYSHSFSRIDGDTNSSQSVSSIESIKMQPTFYEKIFGVRPLSVDDTSTSSSFHADLSSSCRASLSSLPSIIANSSRSLKFFLNSDRISSSFSLDSENSTESSRIRHQNDNRRKTCSYDSFRVRIFQEICMSSDEECCSSEK